MKIRVLVDNIADGELTGEWGLAVWIEHEGHRFLLDTGTTGVFADNARLMGVKLEDVEYGVLSHAHYDHADGLDRFFAENHKADFYIREGAGENCYGWKEDHYRYNGIRPGILERYRDRIVYADGDYELMQGVYLIPHKTSGLEKIGERAKLFVKIPKSVQASGDSGVTTVDEGCGGMCEQIVPDAFVHEQSLVFERADGLIIFNSCCHAGADTVIREIAETFPGKRILALVGGFHLFRSSADEVRELAERIRDTGIERIITGHCTGQEAFDLLKEELGETAVQMYTGMELEL